MWDKILDFISRIRGKTKACRLYERVGRYASLSPTSICRLHEAVPRTPCPSSPHFCGKESTYFVYNFDAVKEYYCKKNKTVEVLPSVDAVLYKDKRFLFVEIKSWQNFERFHIKSSDSEAVIEHKIQKKAKSFKLKAKVDNSIEICKAISNDQYLFTKIPATYVLVTDVDTVSDPLVRFRARLGALGYKSVYIPLYNNASLLQLATVGMDVRYVFCRQFDNFIDSLI